MSVKIHWQEGLFLQPHHLQRMQKSIDDILAAERRLRAVSRRGKLAYWFDEFGEAE